MDIPLVFFGEGLLANWTFTFLPVQKRLQSFTQHGMVFYFKVMPLLKICFPFRIKRICFSFNLNVSSDFGGKRIVQFQGSFVSSSCGKDPVSCVNAFEVFIFYPPHSFTGVTSFAPSP